MANADPANSAPLRLHALQRRVLVGCTVSAWLTLGCQGAVLEESEQARPELRDAPPVHTRGHTWQGPTWTLHQQFRSKDPETWPIEEWKVASRPPLAVTTENLVLAATL
eukprot:TRINITY_DN66317_c0_g1_i1.p1 TRINITY_DN66317_c0_g1~~TRINITY_DN66317_c0_g1_i1.p1  ORF type:complete len:109 (-),score=13.63 TRINITY_DN66317_c0_g1_i1:98-424(-)